MIADGIGHNPNTAFNAFYHAKKPNYDRLFKELPHSLINTSSLAVGLPKGQMGNSEVGHMCMGSGRKIYQNLSKINKLIKDNKLNENKNLKAFLKTHQTIHLIGLYSDGGVHSMNTHFDELLKIISKTNKLFIHPICDGRDSALLGAKGFISKLAKLAKEKKASFGSLSGRFYAMDRDKRWDRVRLYLDALLGEAEKSEDFLAYIDECYAKNISDEFIPPRTYIDFKGMDEEDGLIFINFRNDRLIELVSALCMDDFKPFKRKKLFKNILTMSIYDESFKLASILDKLCLENTLSECISRAGLSQLHTAETEKYAHVTFFFNAQKKEPLKGEKRVLIPSPKVKSYDSVPKMSIKGVYEAVCAGMDEGRDFIVVNFANGDMVGHTGNFKAAIKAVEAVDEAIGIITKKADKLGYSYIITADHGNCELMKDSQGIRSSHTPFPVYLLVKAKGIKAIKPNMSLCNIASTVLKILNIEVPKEMYTDFIKE